MPWTKIFLKSQEVAVTLYSLIPLTLAFVGITELTFYMYAILFFMDWLTGLGKSYAIGTDITSKRNAEGMYSKFWNIFIPIAIALGGRGMGVDLSWFVNASMGILIAQEVYSVIGNVYTIKTREPVTERNATSILMKSAMSYLKQIAERLQKGIDAVMEEINKKD